MWLRHLTLPTGVPIPHAPKSRHGANCRSSQNSDVVEEINARALTQPWLAHERTPHRHGCVPRGCQKPGASSPEPDPNVKSPGAFSVRMTRLPGGHGSELAQTCCDSPGLSHRHAAAMRGQQTERDNLYRPNAK